MPSTRLGQAARPRHARRLDALDDRLLARIGRPLAAVVERQQAVTDTVVVAVSRLLGDDPEGGDWPGNDLAGDGTDGVARTASLGPEPGPNDPRSAGPSRVLSRARAGAAVFDGARIVAGLVAAVIVVAVVAAVVHPPRTPARPEASAALARGEPVRPAEPAVTELPTPPTAGVGKIGPSAGLAPAAYVAASRVRLDDLAARGPGDLVLAVVDFADYQTVAATIALTGGYRVVRAFVRPPPAGGTFAVAVSDPGADLPPALRAVAAALGGRAGAEPDPDRRGQLVTSEQLLLDGHPSVIGVVVRAEAARLRRLAAAAGVRAVDPGTSPTYDPTAFVPLDPASR